MIPLRDENPTAHTPFATYALIALNLYAWIVIQGFGTEPRLAHSVCTLGLIPGELLGTLERGTIVVLSTKTGCVLDGSGGWWTIFTSMFLHGHLPHLIGNLWFLWVFGGNVEDALGSLRFVAFYLLCGAVAAAAQIWAAPSSAIPMIGASGAIGGVMGGYGVLYPRARVHMVFPPFLFFTVAIPALAMLAYWFLLQVVGGLPQLSGETEGVAFWAHIGGFVAGVAVVRLLRQPERLAAHQAQPLRQTARYRF